MPGPIDAPSVNKTEELKSGGGFYLKLSDALPLDRHPPDNRAPACKNVDYNLQELSDNLDVAIVITYHNEPMSTLLRSVHSILNFTPPPLVREIILVDDFSNTTALLPGNEVEQYLPYLPKVRLIRMEQRSGIVPARMRGIRSAKAPVVVILDSHIEVNEGWLEPQLLRIQESPKSFVFPQTLSIVATSFDYTKDSGIGCFVSFDWNVQEKSQVAGFWGSTSAMPSPMHGGGLLAFRKDTFFEIGGYDEGFSMWGAENVEFSFRIWMCGAKLECAPCANVYHIFRSGGTGYHVPAGSVWRNRMRTAQLWMGDYLPLAAAFNSFHLSHSEPLLADTSKMLKLKEKLQCKDIHWFLKEVDPNHEFRDLNTALSGIGDVRSVYRPNICLDALGETDVGNTVGLYQCHGQLGNQGFMLINESKQLRFIGTGKVSRSRLCMKPPGVFEKCTKQQLVGHMAFDAAEGSIRWTGQGPYEDHCLGLAEDEALGKWVLTWSRCTAGDARQQWAWPPFPSPLYFPKQLTEGYEAYKALEAWREQAVEIRSKKDTNYCLDALQQRYAGSPLSVFWCHGELGTQGFTFIAERSLLLAHARGTYGTPLLCVGPPKNLYSCSDTARAKGVSFSSDGRILWRQANGSDAAETLCLTVLKDPTTPISKRTIVFESCRPGDLAQLWEIKNPLPSAKMKEKGEQNG
ncbi:n-acetylgalactosaminyl transferase [Cyclospora cayetanensis]|uniref:N-acetylgalactosaminyl transferase n=1 Tax=Cyclospora cayetanensis TaxID=88456 RepID=A0A1D3CZ72_9EIME|nr:n-acetylgalactosaminyl transferase [Cyclospora cayetanensis]